MNLTKPSYIALVGSLLLGVVVLFTLYLIESLVPMDLGTITFVLVPLVTVSISFAIFTYFVSRSINRKIKFIYDIISHERVSENSEYRFSEDVLTKLTNDTAEWAAGQKQQISQLQKQAMFRKEFLGNLAHELKEADDVIVNISQKSVKQRIAETLLYLEENFGVDHDGFMIIQLSREDISNIVGTATESCIRMLSELKKESLIETSGKKIQISDVVKMRKLSEGI